MMIKSYVESTPSSNCSSAATEIRDERLEEQPNEHLVENLLESALARERGERDEHEGERLQACRRDPAMRKMESASNRSAPCRTSNASTRSTLSESMPN